jgi:DNA (cytosine-5)-methyltransferase 1
MSNRLVSLFCGCGGLDEGFAQAGFETGVAYDVSFPALRSFARNHGLNSKRAQANTRIEIDDLSEVSPAKIVAQWELNESGPPVGVIGGPPCQAFSVSNVHRKYDDPRAKLVQHYAQILEALAIALSPKFFVLENVIGLAMRTHRPVLDEFKARAAVAGYRVFETPLDAQYFGVPQHRVRVFAVGIHKSTGTEHFSFPKGSESPLLSVRDAIGSLPPPALFERGMRPALSWFHPNHWAMMPKSAKFAPGNLRPGQIRGRSFRVLPWDEVSPTVAYGHREVHVHPIGTRRLSVLEALLLQGFPSDYVLEGTLSQQITQVSDAVPPPLARAIAEAIAEQLGLHPAVAETQPSRNGHAPHAGFVGVQTMAPKSTNA